ncbi:polysaccharide deacetylase family protein [Bacteriovoracales bacterium]|nr:polysaccharide deacetylase family protein [Bacteriovoracales bacterium]
MMKLKHQIRKTISFAYSIGHLRPLRPGGRVLMYHSIEKSVDMDPTGLFTVPLKYFKDHLNEIDQNEKWNVQHFSDCTTEEKGLLSITFDDGYKNNLTLAAPLLIEKNLPFTVFISTNFVKEKHPDFLTPSELKELASYPGVTIGAHGAKHCSLANLPEEKMVQEMEGSKKYLEDLLGKEVLTMSYPFGHTNKKVMEIGKLAGYKRIGTSRFDTNRPSTNPLLLNRCEVNKWDNLKSFRSKLLGHWDWYRYR